MSTLMRRHALLAQAGGGGDPYWANVVASLTFVGADGSTTFDDATGRTWTPAGDAQIDTSLEYNTGLFDGSADYIYAATDTTAAFGMGDFCIEAWVYQTARSSGAGVIFDSLPLNGDGARYNSLTFYIDRWGYLRSWQSATDQISGGTLVPLNTLTHIALTRESGTLRTFVAGTLSASAYYNVNDTLGGFVVGTAANVPTASGYQFNGHLRALRVTKGVARYTSGFTPPAAPFPDS